MPQPRARRPPRLPAALAALTLCVGLAACGGGGTATPDVSGAPPFTVPTSAADASLTSSTSSSSSSSSSSTSTTAAANTGTTAASSTSAATSTTPSAGTTTAAGTATTGATGTNGGATLGSAFCQQNPGAC